MTELKSPARRILEAADAVGFSGTPSDPVTDMGISAGTEAHGVENPQVDPNADTWSGHCSACGAPSAMEFEKKEAVVFESKFSKLSKEIQSKKSADAGQKGTRRPVTGRK